MPKYISLIAIILISLYIYQKTEIKLDSFSVLAESDISVLDSTLSKNKYKKEKIDIYTIRDGDTFAKVMESFGIGYDSMALIIDRAKNIVDFTTIRVGRDIRFYFHDGEVYRFEYDIDTEDMAVVTGIGGAYEVKKIPIEYEEELVAVSATVSSSLFAAATSVGVEDVAILRMAEVLAWSIDFSTAIRSGDSFRILYKKRTRQGEPAQPGEILAVQYMNSGIEYNGYSYEDGTGKTVYYNEKGESLIKQFLKAPLRFSRITSGYTGKRFHPVIGKDTEHRAIDYAAPLGTPVVSVGDGVVTFAGWHTAFGNFIKIKHNGTYSTHYAHLSGIAKGVKVGARVAQGDVIGFVGSTGWSTGSHLHYEIEKNGFLVNPLTIELPAGDPVSDGDKEDFFARQKVLYDRMIVE